MPPPLPPGPSPAMLLTAADARVTHPRIHLDAHFHRVRKGVYAVRAEWEALTPWDRYLARVHAFALLHPGVVFSHESAAALLRLPLFGEPRDIHVLDVGRAASRRFGDVCVHTTIDEPEVSSHGLLRMTSAARTAVDLMRVLPPAFALAVGDAAVSPRRGGRASVRELSDLAETQANARGRRRLALLLPMLDGRAESPGESVSRAVIRWLGFEDPDTQAVFSSDGFDDRVDFWWPSVRAIGESDGYGKYRADSVDVAVDRIIDEKRREDRLRRQARAFVRWDWTSAVRVEPLAERLVAAGVPLIRPRSAALLATLRTNPRSTHREINSATKPSAGRRVSSPK